MIWATRQFGVADWFEVRERFRYQYTLMDTPRDMILIATKGVGQNTRLYVGVPHGKLLEPYEGFHKVAGMWIPKKAALLAGDATKFRKSFGWPPRR